MNKRFLAIVAACLMSALFIGPAKKASADETDRLVRVAGQIDVYQIHNNSKRHIPSAEAFNSYGFDWNNIKEITQEEADSYSDDVLVRGYVQYKVYKLTNGVMQWIENQSVFNAFGYSWDDVVEITLTEETLYTKGPSINSVQNTDILPIGSLIRVAGQEEVYQIMDHAKRHISSVEVFNSYGFAWGNVKEVTQEEADKYSDDVLIRVRVRRDGMGDVSELYKIYKLENGVIHWIPTQEIFDYFNYKWENIVEINATEWWSYTKGENVSAPVE